MTSENSTNNFPETDPMEDMELYLLCTQIEREDLYNTYYDQQLYDICVVLEKSIGQTSEKETGTVKRSNSEQNIDDQVCKRQKNEDLASTSNDHVSERQKDLELTSKGSDKEHCDTCQVFVNRKCFTNHVRSKRHYNNILKVHGPLKNVSVAESAFGDRIITYKIVLPNDVVTLAGGHKLQ